ncbi:MAG: phosphoenolpyruvate carboxykinase (ATP), partial [Arcobacteraceae bacterium]|nr:phosphoenolpyruvate carboxykinase (ATP) [Arcobacteraceae bacterium]
MVEIKKSLGLSDTGTIFRNTDIDTLIKNAVLHEGAKISTEGALMIDTGIFTGRSPKDKYFVNNTPSNQYIAWGDINKPIEESLYDKLLNISKEQLNGKDLYITDVYCGSSLDSRKSIRFVTEIAWQAHFIQNMFIVPTKDELETFTPEFTIYNACKTTNMDWKEDGLHSEVFV